MSKHGGKGRDWHRHVFGDSGYLCQAETHDPRCDGFPTEAHHIVYRSHLVDEAMWLSANGIALNQYCHMLAHASHNANIADVRLRRAVDAVNAVQGHRPEFRRPHFFDKGLRGGLPSSAALRT
jgi:hypothetical protein